MAKLTIKLLILIVYLFQSVVIWQNKIKMLNIKRKRHPSCMWNDHKIEICDWQLNAEIRKLGVVGSKLKQL